MPGHLDGPGWFSVVGSTPTPPTKNKTKRTMNKISAALITIGALSTMGVLVYGIETGTMREHEHAFMFSIITFLLGICAHVAKELKRWD